MKKEKKEAEELTAPFWMATYGDMVTLLLTFFILLLSYSTIQIEKFKGAMESLKGALGVFDGHESPVKEPYVAFNSSVTNGGPPKPAESVQAAMKQLEELLVEQNMEGMLEVELHEDGALFRLGDELLFEPGRATVKREAHEVLGFIAEMIRGSNSKVSVEGHTDNIPIHTRRFPSNWELSSSRALNVVKYLSQKEKIAPQLLSAVGHGEHRPIVPNDSRANRAKNRRVEILMEW